jgi:hypothetical protein
MPAWSWNDYLRALCAIFAALSLSMAVAIDGTAIDTYRIFLRQRSVNNPWWLPLWPQHFDTTGTKVLIGASSGLALLNIVLLGLSVFPTVYSSSRFIINNVLTLLVQSNITGETHHHRNHHLIDGFNTGFAFQHSPHCRPQQTHAELGYTPNMDVQIPTYLFRNDEHRLGFDERKLCASLH